VQEAPAVEAHAPPTRRFTGRLRSAWSRERPARSEWALAAASALLLILSFPDFNLWPLAWVALVPLSVAVVGRRMRGATAFVLGWATGTVFFYATCWWLTHAMVYYGGLPRLVAFPLLFPGALVVGLFPALWAFALSRLATRWGSRALVCAPFLWAALEWARLGVTGQLWNAIGYSQAFQPQLIQAASWGGVYAVGFLILTVNAAIAYALIGRTKRAAVCALLALSGVSLVLIFDASSRRWQEPQARPAAVVVAVQPNVSANFSRPAAETALLVERHLEMSRGALGEWNSRHPRAVERRGLGAPQPDGSGQDLVEAATPRVVVWPESPMNFTYARDARFRELVARFAREQGTSVLFNALEPAPANGGYNSAVMINEEGRLVAQYDKIRLLPFGEYVPLPRWLPLTWLLGGIVGDFTPGTEYPLMPLGSGDDRAQVGVFICFESAFPSIARTFADKGADVLVNIANDGYLGRTPVIRQHLANVVFRAVETGRHVLRVTNTGTSARITPRGEVFDETETFQTAVRTWPVARAGDGKTFYTRHGDLFAAVCVALSILALATTLRVGRRVRSIS
jgi:apolipoprotein N-acyltransferase